jgi:hypothetical protein
MIDRRLIDLNIREEYESYMEAYFPHIQTYPFYVTDKLAWIRFELGVPGEWRIREASYLNSVYQKAITLFEEIHFPNDEIFLLVVDYAVSNKRNRYKKTKIFERFIKEKALIHRLHMVTDVWHNFEEERCSYSYLIKCKVSQLK